MSMPETLLDTRRCRRTHQGDSVSPTRLGRVQIGDMSVTHDPEELHGLNTFNSHLMVSDTKPMRMGIMATGQTGQSDPIVSSYQPPTHVELDASRPQDPRTRGRPGEHNRSVRTCLVLLFCIAVASLIVSVLPDGGSNPSTTLTITGYKNAPNHPSAPPQGERAHRTFILTRNPP